MIDNAPGYQIPLYVNVEEFKRFTAVLNAESDRGAVLVAASMLDEQLSKLISGMVIQHADTKKLTEGFNSPLGTFSAKIIAAFAMGVIDLDEYEELERIRKIRNAFAHSIYIDLKDQGIRDRCKDLRFSFGGENDKNNMRSLFLSAAAMLVAKLTHKTNFLDDCRLRLIGWPTRLANKKN